MRMSGINAMSRFLLPLNDTAIVFLHPDDTGVGFPYAAQITVKSERPSNVGILTAYYLAQHEITDLILRVICAHMRDSLPHCVVFEGKRYTLIATRRRWSYGQNKVKLTWGEEAILACDHKWTFSFDVKGAEITSISQAE